MSELQKQVMEIIEEMPEENLTGPPAGYREIPPGKMRTEAKRPGPWQPHRRFCWSASVSA